KNTNCFRRKRVVYFHQIIVVFVAHLSRTLGERGLFFQSRLAGFTAQRPIKDQPAGIVVEEKLWRFLPELSAPQDLIIGDLAQLKPDLAVQSLFVSRGIRDRNLRLVT